jgi:preprotein translocase subunit SecG
MLRIALTILQFFCALVIIGLVLIQRGKGAEAGAGFGAGASGTVFGARGAGTALSRATAIFAALFMLNSLVLGYVGSHEAAAQPKTILDSAGESPTPRVGTSLPPLSPRAVSPSMLNSGSAGHAPVSVPSPPASAPGSVPAQPPTAPGRK